jgi:hypothetical protein
MTEHGYSGLPAYCFWRETVCDRAPHNVDPVVAAKFKISRTDRVATAGSCFAQHISRRLLAAKFNYLVTETAHPLFNEHCYRGFNYGVYSARYGNIFTVRQLKQLLQRAYGLYAPEEDVWRGEGERAIDPFRPIIQPRGFACNAELRADRAQHFDAVRRAIEIMDVLVFTLGLTEAWVSRRDGAIYPLCPGVAGGEFDRERYKLHNFRVHEVVEDLGWVAEFIASKNARAKLLLTVSPVPLAATAEDRSVLVSTTYSKSVLRVAAEEISQSYPYVAYYPAYEIITGSFTRGAYFDVDLRKVTDAGVDHVMRLFMQHYAADGILSEPPSGDQPSGRDQEVGRVVAEMQAASQAMCDEEVLARRAL